MRKILFVSIAFPPKNDPECFQAARYCKYLVSNGMDVEVVTSSMPTLYMPYDRSVQEYFVHRVKRIEIPIYESRLSNLVMRKISPVGVNFPDSKFTFFRQWRKVTRQITNAPDIIYSRSNPISSALMALNLRRYYKVPWIMHLSDPWVGSPAIRYTSKEQSFNERWEATCVEEASRISFTTKETLAFYGSKYPGFASKFFLSPNVFDGEQANVAAPDLSGRLRIIYTGGLAGSRSPEFFLEGCRAALVEEPDLANIEVIFAGPIDRRNQSIISASGLSFVRHIGHLPYGSAIQLQQSAHILLTIDEPVNKQGHAMFFPSKILDYFLANRKVVAITNRNSTTSQILSACSANVIYYPDIDSMKRFLCDAVAAFRRKDTDFFTGPSVPSHFGAEENALKLITIMKSL